MATRSSTSPNLFWLATIREFATDAMMEMIRADLALLNVKMDVFSSEKAVTATGRIEEAIGRLRALGLIYEGMLEPPKGKTPEDWEPREQTLFRSTNFGDDRRPAGEEIGRHLDLFCARYRLPLGQDRSRASPS